MSDYTRKIAILISRYAKAAGIDKKFVQRAYKKGDVFQKRQDLISMRAFIYLKKHIAPGMSQEEKDKVVADFMATEPNIDKVRWTMPGSNGHGTPKSEPILPT